jgi:hypothetical protein
MSRRRERIDPLAAKPFHGLYYRDVTCTVPKGRGVFDSRPFHLRLHKEAPPLPGPDISYRSRKSGRRMTARVSELSNAASRIADVVELINTIAGPTKTRQPPEPTVERQPDQVINHQQPKRSKETSEALMRSSTSYE